MLAENGGGTLHFDATGGIVTHEGKTTNYYALVARDFTQQLEEHERRKIIPMLECISGAHDAYNISLMLSEYKYNFHVQYPSLKLSVKRVVTDMSYAIINAICYGWNNIKLINYINFMYDVSTGSTVDSDLTMIRVCCGHIAKNYSKEVEEHYPHLPHENRVILKEIFAEMFDIDNMKLLMQMWELFSTVLLCREKFAVGLKTTYEQKFVMEVLCAMMMTRSYNVLKEIY